MADIGSAANIIGKVYAPVVGSITGSAPAAGNLGERIESNSTTNQTATTSTQFSDLLSISLTAGVWDVTALAISNGNASTFSSFRYALSLNSGNTTTDHVNGKNVTETTASTAFGTNDRDTVGITPWRVTVSATTTVYFKQAFTYTVGTPATRFCSMGATRVG
jgi:hypothetical protein